MWENTGGYPSACRILMAISCHQLPEVDTTSCKSTRLIIHDGLSESAQICKIEQTSPLEHKNDLQVYNDKNSRKTKSEEFPYLTNLLPIFILLSIFGVRHVGFRSETSHGPRQSCGDMAIIDEILALLEPKQKFWFPSNSKYRSITRLARWRLSHFDLATDVEARRQRAVYSCRMSEAVRRTV